MSPEKYPAEDVRLLGAVAENATRGFPSLAAGQRGCASLRHPQVHCRWESPQHLALLAWANPFGKSAHANGGHADEGGERARHRQAMGADTRLFAP